MELTLTTTLTPEQALSLREGMRHRAAYYGWPVSREGEGEALHPGPRLVVRVVARPAPAGGRARRRHGDGGAVRNACLYRQSKHGRRAAGIGGR